MNGKDSEDFSYPRVEPWNFGGLDNQDYKTAQVVVFPVPYDSTTYYMGGAKQGPFALINASRHMELYDLEKGKDVSTVGIFTLEPLEPSKNSPEETIDRVESVIAKIIQDGKFPLMLGGEHSVTLGCVRAFHKKYGTDFTVVHFDAHTDLRDEFQGTRFHHGSVMRRTTELGIPVTHMGIRSVSEEEMEYLKGKGKEENFVFYAERKHTLEEMINTLRENVYITVDVDVLDSSAMPATGTPEPGGLTWYQIIDAVRAIGAKKKIIGADVVELAPIPGMVAPDFLAAKLAYKIIGFALT